MPFYFKFLWSYLGDTSKTATHVMSNMTPFPLLLASILLATRLEYVADNPPPAATAGPMPGTKTPKPPMVL